MEVVSLSPLPVASLLWQHRPGGWALTFVAKATCQLQPVQSPLAADQEPVNEDDNYWDDDDGRSLYAASDLAPVKPRADVVLVGSAYAPAGQTVRSLFARLIVGEIDKSVEVCQDRSFAADGKLVEGQRFARMSLAYERAGGGPDTSNPVGVRHDVRDAYGRIKLPNLQPPGLSVVAPGTVIPPIGFGPIPPTWPLRRGKLGRHSGSYSPHSLRATPLPEDLETSFFNAAPADQQLAELPEDARLVLENMHPQIPRLVTSLPGLRPRAALEGRRGVHALPLRLDTLWIDTDRMLATLTFRGQLQLERADEPGRVVIKLEEATSNTSAPSPLPEVRKSAKTFIIDDEDTGVVEPSESPTAAAPQPALPFLKAAPAQSVREDRSNAGLPFAKPTPWPAVVPPAAPSAPAIAPPPVPPKVVPAKAVPAKATADDSVWASGVSRVDVPSGQSIGQMVAAASMAASPPQETSPGALGPSYSSSAPIGRRDGGVRPVARLDSNELLHLLWFHPDSVNRICRTPVWRAILDDMERERADEAHDVPTLARDPAEVEDTRDIFDIVARGAAQDVDQLEAEIVAAVRPGGKFVPPLVLLMGELVFPFDERETLRTVIAVATPVAGTDEVLKSAIRDAREFLAMADSCPSPIVEGYTARLREAFGRGRRSLTPETFEGHVERQLLEGRHYQKRQVLGMVAIRALLHTATGTGARPAPVYLPEDLARRLPMFSRFRARLIAELYVQEDQHESHPAALAIRAIGRVQSLSERRQSLTS